MFFKHKHLLEELRANGRQATAEIISMRTVGEGSTMRAAWAADDDLSAGWMDCSMDLRVLPHGEPPFEAKVLTRIHTLKFKGGSVPVWYDPADHSRVVVDYEADLVSKTEGLNHLERSVHRYDQRIGLAWTPLGGEILAVEVMAKGGKGRVIVPGALGRLLGDVAPAVVAVIRGRAAQLAPELPADWFARNDISIDAPYGAWPHTVTPEEATSAGLAIAAALVSLIGGHMVRVDVALTGVLSPAGELLPVTGIQEKVHAAKQGGAALLVLPAASQSDALHVRQDQHRGLEYVFAATLDEALHTAMTRKPVNRQSRLP
jgi:hypothetical protein